MNQRQNFFYTAMVIACTVFIGALLLLMTSKAFAINQPAKQAITGSIVVTLKPLYSLVAHLTDGIETPTLLIKQMPSSHHYTMRPSERRKLANARLIIWFGPTMETFLTKVIQQQKNTNPQNTTVISVMQAKQLNLLSRRSRYPHENEKQATANKSNPDMIDPHIWLSTHNAAAISKYISAALINYDPKNTRIYKTNLQRLLNKIEQTKIFIETTLGSEIMTGQPPFIAYHDAFQYFADENRLNYIDSISYNEETGPGMKHLRRIKTLIEEKNIQCLVYQPPKPSVIDSLTNQTPIKATALDPLGLNVDDDKNAWFILMRQLATDFKQCLKQ